jgi:hypothetical protein
MPDISMCMNDECPSRVSCFRFRAEPHPYRQAYTDFKVDGDKCDSYADVKLWTGYAIRAVDAVKIFRRIV